MNNNDERTNPTQPDSSPVLPTPGYQPPVEIEAPAEDPLPSSRDPIDGQLSGSPYVEEKSVNSVQPAVGPVPPLSNNQSLVAGQPPVVNQSFAQPSAVLTDQEPKKSSHLALWISIAVALTILACLLAGYLIAKGMSDNEAHVYQKNAAAYLDSAKSKVDSAVDATEAREAFSGMAQPKLNDTFMSNLSSEYRDAQTTQNNLAVEAESIKKDLDKLAGVNQFYEDYGDLAEDVQAVSEGMVSSGSRAAITDGLTKLTSLIERGEAIVDKATLPNDLDKAKNDVAAALAQEVSSLKEMSAAFAKNDSTAYYDALSDFTTAAGDESRALGPIRTYYYDLNNKKDDIVKDIETLRSKIDAGASTADA